MHNMQSDGWPYLQTFIPVVRTFPSPASKLATSGYYCVNVGSFQTCSQFFTTTIVVCSTSSVEKTWKNFARVPVLCFLSVCCIRLSTKLLNKLSHINSSQLHVLTLKLWYICNRNSLSYCKLQLLGAYYLLGICLLPCGKGRLYKNAKIAHVQ